MARFSPSMLERIRSINIANIIEPYVELKLKGRDLWGLCPFHHEKSPSFKVDAEKGFFKCFGCDAKGDGVTFVMRQLGFSYYDAVIYLAEKYGINIELEGEENIRSKDIIALHEEIQKISRKMFYSLEGEKAKEYILSRNFDDDDFNEFGIGYLSSNVDYSSIYKSFSKEVLYDSGFFKESQYKTPYSRFFSRLMLPIRNITSSIAAFAGRSLDGSNPKYLNSAESSVFHKGSTLFNIDKAKNAMKQNKQALIVEGYFDVMRLYKNGFKNVAAPMGTALTSDQINILKRYAEEVTVMFDGDSAGEKAAFRSLERFAETSLFPKVIFLPQEDDPDSFVLNNGIDKFYELYNKREDLFIHMIKRLSASSKDDFNIKLSRFKAVTNMLAKINNPHVRDYYVDAASEIFKLKKENIYEDLKQNRYKKNMALSKNNTGSMYLCEMDFVACLSRLPIDIIDNLLTDFNLDMINDIEIKNILKIMLANLSKISDIREITHELGNQFVELAMREIAEDDIYKDALKNKNQIELNFLKKRQNELIEQMRTTSDKVMQVNILQELNSLTKQIAGKK
ncbi:DNA primase [uncultured Megamonas sp.]|uniref:DNA primase n=1 Tax=uncultured Megamonas sp. TaxID=286140 RepID=UPI00259655CF|nr:DNA primase [uncultured Megamonas sp.]